MRGIGVVFVVLGGLLWTAGSASGGVDPRSPGCQAVDDFVDGTVAYHVEFLDQDFFDGEEITVSVDFTGWGDGTGWLSAAVFDGTQYFGWPGADGPVSEVPVALRETVIDALSDRGFYVEAYGTFYLPADLAEGDATPVYGAFTLDCSPAIDTDGDGLFDYADNFPTVYSRCRTSQATIIGTSGADNPLNGTSGADVIMGLGGADVIYGLEGDDLICAGNGADIAYGGDGKDVIYGENGPDTIYGNEKSDRLYGGDNDDVILGGDGTRDRLYGGAGVNDLDGGAGDDDRCTLGPTFNRCETISQ